MGLSRIHMNSVGTFTWYAMYIFPQSSFVGRLPWATYPYPSITVELWFILIRVYPHIVLHSIKPPAGSVMEHRAQTHASSNLCYVYAHVYKCTSCTECALSCSICTCYKFSIIIISLYCIYSPKTNARLLEGIVLRTSHHVIPPRTPSHSW